MPDLQSALFAATTAATAAWPSDIDEGSYETLELERRGFWDKDVLQTMEGLVTYQKYFKPENGWSMNVTTMFPPAVSGVRFITPVGGMLNRRNGKWTVNFELTSHPDRKFEKWREARDAAKELLMGIPLYSPDSYCGLARKGSVDQVLRVGGREKMRMTRTPSIKIAHGRHLVRLWRRPREPLFVGPIPVGFR